MAYNYNPNQVLLNSGVASLPTSSPSTKPTLSPATQSPSAAPSSVLTNHPTSAPSTIYQVHYQLQKRTHLGQLTAPLQQAYLFQDTF